MEHIAIDLRSRESQICRRNAAGDILEERRCGTSELETYLVDARAPAILVVETCTEAFRVAEGARRYGHEVRIVPSTLVQSLGVGQRGLKNDVRDAVGPPAVRCQSRMEGALHVTRSAHPDANPVDQRRAELCPVAPIAATARNARASRGMSANDWWRPSKACLRISSGFLSCSSVSTSRLPRRTVNSRDWPPLTSGRAGS